MKRFTLFRLSLLATLALGAMWRSPAPAQATKDKKADPAAVAPHRPGEGPEGSRRLAITAAAAVDPNS